MTTERNPGVGSHACVAPTLDGSEVIHVDCVSHIYPDGSVGIHDMCFKVKTDEIVALCGPNGSGKSTLIEHLNGLLFPSQGRVVFHGAAVDRSVGSDLWREVGVVFQRTDDQLFAPTVLDDVMFGPLNMGLSPEEARREALAALQKIGAADLVQKMPHYLSAGQKRLVAIAGVFAMHPKVIALDEPTSDLDPLHAETIERLIRELRSAHHISIVISTHDLDFAARIADRVCIVKSGSIIAEGPPAEIFYDRDLMKEAGLKQPLLVQVYEEFCQASGIRPDRKPLSIQEVTQEMRLQITVKPPGSD
jgi:cobalt/nickel transport system ATP-binding protein